MFDTAYYQNAGVTCTNWTVQGFIWYVNYGNKYLLWLLHLKKCLICLWNLKKCKSQSVFFPPQVDLLHRIWFGLLLPYCCKWQEAQLTCHSHPLPPPPRLSQWTEYCSDKIDGSWSSSRGRGSTKPVSPTEQRWPSPIQACMQLSGDFRLIADTAGITFISSKLNVCMDWSYIEHEIKYKYIINMYVCKHVSMSVCILKSRWLAGNSFESVNMLLESIQFGRCFNFIRSQDKFWFPVVSCLSIHLTLVLGFAFDWLLGDQTPILRSLEWYWPGLAKP